MVAARSSVLSGLHRAQIEATRSAWQQLEAYQ
jgi:hypothetical protein